MSFEHFDIKIGSISANAVDLKKQFKKVISFLIVNEIAEAILQNPENI